jgi:rubrerythrin
MPSFENPPLSAMKEGMLTDEELAAALRFSIAAELEAIQIYEQYANATDNPLAKKVLISVANEEKIHVGEFLELIYQLFPDEKKFYEEGMREARELGVSGPESEEPEEPDESEEPEEPEEPEE